MLNPSRIQSGGLTSVVHKLLKASLADRTILTYERYLQRFTTFCLSLCLIHLPASPETITMFIAHLHKSGYAPSTIASHVSAIALLHKLSLYPDPTSHFLPHRALLGCRKTGSNPDIRHPILLKDLNNMLEACFKISSFYEATLYRCIFSVAFHGFFRIGELLPNSNASCYKTIHISDIRFTSKMASIQLNHYKTKKSNQPLLIKLHRTNSSSNPIRLLRKYLKLRGQKPGPIFMSHKNKNITHSMFNSYLKKVLNFLNMPTKLYKGHSFRIGACTQASISKVPDATIKALGRWKSDAYKRYIRPHFV